MDRRRHQTLSVLAGGAALAVALSGCGNGPQRTKAQDDAASACQQLTNLESSIANKEGPGRSQAGLVLSNSQRLVNEAAALDGRWKRLQVDVTLIRQDLDNGSTTASPPRSTTPRGSVRRRSRTGSARRSRPLAEFAGPGETFVRKTP